MAFSEETLYAMVKDLNGPDSYSVESAAFGYVSDDERLFIPRSLFEKCNNDYDPEVDKKAPWEDWAMIGDDPSSDEMAHFCGSNYDSLVKSGLDPRASAWVAWYRLTLSELEH